MRASRILRLLLLLQNRGRQTATALAAELEVTPRTVLRDVDALSEAGLPILTRRGAGGGIELGFNYRSRLTGLAEDEAAALGLSLAAPCPALESIGLGDAARRASTKLIESLPDRTREVIARARSQFQLALPAAPDADRRVAALALAIRERRMVSVRTGSVDPCDLYPCHLALEAAGWSVTCARSGECVPLAACGDITISARRFG
jgi:predicted DNA-binding transcriptional regulator YafY